MLSGCAKFLGISCKRPLACLSVALIVNHSFSTPSDQEIVTKYFGPPIAKHHTNRGWTYFRMGNYEQAIADYNQALQLDPDDGLIYRNRAEAYEAMGNKDQAIADYKKTLNCLMTPKAAVQLKNA